MIRRVVLLGVVAAVSAALPATAHRPATVVVLRPAEGAVVTGERVEVELAGEGGFDPATFELRLDGENADERGRVPARSPFTTFRIGPGERQTLRLELPRSGRHELVVLTRGDADAPSRRVVRRFTSRPGGGLPVLPIAAGLVVAAGAAAALVLRRRSGRLTRGVAPGGDGAPREHPGAGPAAGPAGP